MLPSGQYHCHSGIVPHMTPRGQAVARHIGSIERAVAVLNTLADSPSDLGTNEIARRTKVNPSSVSRLLATLAGGGLVVRVPETGRYRLGVRLIQLGNAAMARLDLRDIARPHLTALAGLTGETATLSIPGEHEAITIDFVQSASSVQSVARLGRPSVPHATAIGKLFLAHGGRLPEGSLEGFTDRTIVDPEALAAEVSSIAERGWAESAGEREVDLNALAVPVVDGEGALRAILGLQGPEARFNHEAMSAALGPLLENARSISARWTG